jgi:putative flippase GtrA
VASTIVHLGLFAALAATIGSVQTANLVALLVATVVNTGLNRRWTFGVQGDGVVRHQLQGMGIFALTWLMTAGALALLHLLVAAPNTLVATGVLAAAPAASTALRFVAMRSWMFRGRPQYSVTMNEPESSSNTTTPVQSQPSTDPRQTVTSP